MKPHENLSDFSTSSETILYSFDIFDTVITRKTATPKGVFAAMAYRIGEQYRDVLSPQILEDFYLLRIDAEKRARQKSSRQDITFEDIYRELGERYALDDNILESLKNLEIEMEREMILPIPATVERIGRHLDEGRRVVFVSNMYLPTEIIRTFLAIADERFAECPVYMSSKVGLVKTTGDLFRYVAEQEGVEFSQILHVGDDRITDVLAPQKLGIRVEPVHKETLGPYEERYFKEPFLFYQLAAGAAKNMRLLTEDFGPNERVAASFAAPVCFGFVRDVLENAKRHGVHRLYFVAREGQILLRLANVAAQTLDWDFDLRYIHLSRFPIRVASVFHLTERELDWVFRPSPVLTFRQIAARLLVDSDWLYERQPRDIQTRIPSQDEPIDAEGPVFTLLKRSFLQDEDLLKLNADRSASEREKVLNYLKGRGFFEDNPVGLVDMGWTTTTQDALYKIVCSHNPSLELVGYYFGVLHGTPYSKHTNRKIPYLLQPKLGWAAFGSAPVTCMELLAQGTHGTTVGYDQDDEGNWVALLGPDPGTKAWGVERFHDEMECWCRLYVEYSKPFPQLCESFKELSANTLTLLNDPNRELAEVLGSIPFSGDQNDEALGEVAPPFSLSDALRFIASPQEVRKTMTGWTEASMERSSGLSHLLLREYWWHTLSRMVLHPRVGLDALKEKKQVWRDALGRMKQQMIGKRKGK